jgi:hypothetical protein
MEVARTSESSVNFYQTTRRNNPEDSHLHTRRRENLKSHIIISNFKAWANWSVPRQLSSQLAMFSPF